MLTGKAKEKFKQWIFKEYGRNVADILYFEDILKYALYIDFFDSVGIYIQPFIPNETGYWADGFDRKAIYNDRPEATKAAIGRTNDLYNEKQL